MKKPIFPLLLSAISASLFAPLSAEAETLTPQQALSRVTPSATASTTPFRSPAATAYATPVLSRTVMKPESDNPAIYIFNSADGLMIVSADDITPVGLLGWTSGGNAQALPPALEWWLGEYAREIAEAPILAATSTTDAPDERQPIGPLMSTKWNQDAPFNNLCPEYQGSRCVTGCVATAMAQVMKYHEWPATGKQSNSYPWQNSTISMDFSKVTFDWANMLNAYGSDATDAECEAVAQLMYAAGVAVNMQYSPSASGTADFYVPMGLVNFMNYDKGIRYVERDYFTSSAWEELIYTQLRDYGPVQYSGSSNVGGHSFVCDGYSANHYFHFNWGWGGVSDGYFRLSALDPGQQGIGGSSSGFNSSQSAIINIRKAGLNRYVYDNVMMPYGFAISETSSRPGKIITVSATTVNYSIQPISGVFTVKITNDATGEVTHCVGKQTTDWPVLYSISSYPVSLPSDLPVGTYTLTPEWVNSRGQYQDIPVKLSASGSVRMTVTNNSSCTFTTIEPGAITATSVTMLTPIYASQQFKLTATLVNNGDLEYLGNIVPALASGNTLVAQADSYIANVPAHSSVDIEYQGAFNRFADSEGLTPGTYTLYLMDTTSGHQVSTGISVTYQAAPADGSLSVKDFTLVGNADEADPHNLTFSGTLICDDGYFGGQAIVVVFPYTQGNVQSVAAFTTPTLFLEAGDEADFTAGGAIPNCEHGSRFFAVLFNGQTQISKRGEEVIFTIANSSGTEQIFTTTNDDASVHRIYSISGIYLGNSTDSLSPGIYILETSSSRRLIRL